MTDTTPRLAYTVSHEAWYWALTPPPAGLMAEIVVAREALGPDGQPRGCDWEFRMLWRTSAATVAAEDTTHDGDDQPQLRLYSEAWPALLELPHLFAALARISVPAPTPAGVAALLTVAGLVDTTPRVNPDDPAAPPASTRTCPDCAVVPGAPHVDGCDVAPCTVCGGQRIGCDHDDTDDGWGAIWTGQWPGDVECERLGLWCLDRTAQGQGWVPCPTGTPGARHDLNALARMGARGELVWDRTAQQWVTPALAANP